MKNLKDIINEALIKGKLKQYNNSDKVWGGIVYGGISLYEFCCWYVNAGTQLNHMGDWEVAYDAIDEYHLFKDVNKFKEFVLDTQNKEIYNVICTEDDNEYEIEFCVGEYTFKAYCVDDPIHELKITTI